MTADLSKSDKLRGAFDAASWGAHADELDVDVGGEGDRIGSVTLPRGASVVVNDDAGRTTLPENLAPHGWEPGTVRASSSGTVVSVWVSRP